MSTNGVGAAGFGCVFGARRGLLVEVVVPGYAGHLGVEGLWVNELDVFASDVEMLSDLGEVFADVSRQPEVVVRDAPGGLKGYLEFS